MRPTAHVFFGTVLPALALFIELLTGACGDVFFDPIPTWWHVGLIAFVGWSNLMAALAMKSEKEPELNLIVFNGLAMGIAAFYSLTMFELIPLGFIGLIAFGLGVIPLAPFFAFLVSAFLAGGLFRNSEHIEQRTKVGWFWSSVLVGGTLALVPMAPAGITTALTRQASVGPTNQRAEALRRLRKYGSEKELLRLCYNQASSWSTRIWQQRTSVDDARQVYFAVTGQPYNSHPRPARQLLSLPSRQFDFELGGEEVAGRNPHVHMTSSRLDVDIEPKHAMAYSEWTLEFRNDDLVSNHEARAQIQLPPGAVVSRLTLWVNGEPREAAFSSTGKVRAAYREVAVVRQRDPVLVTWKGPDRVLVQCFPILPGGGEMKIRLGITAPIPFENGDGQLRLPRLVERNFQFDQANGDSIHAVWVRCRSTIASNHLEGFSTRAQFRELHRILTDDELSSEVLQIPNGMALFEESEIDHSDARWLHTIEQSTEPDPDHVIFVVDGSVALRDAKEEIREALGRWKSTREMPAEVIIAADTVRGPFDIDLEMAEVFEDSVGYGGCDNAPALVRAHAIASHHQNAAIVWIHGPQPVHFRSVAALDQCFSWGTDSIQWLDFEVKPGPNTLLQRDSAVGRMIPFVRIGSIADDFDRLLNRMTGRSTVSVQRWNDPPDGTSYAIAQHDKLMDVWAADQVNAAIKDGERDEAIRLASEHHIVSPVSGAVVLETDDQFKEAGLTPVDAKKRPPMSTPEPTSGLLVLLGACGLLDANRRKLFAVNSQR